uniref:Uncharacterized protein n=1 Tax=Cacopsylla melanoneura TaxID=428564 RepID=A0A8D8Z033_9HEMI
MFPTVLSNTRYITTSIVHTGGHVLLLKFDEYKTLVNHSPPHIILDGNESLALFNDDHLFHFYKMFFEPLVHNVVTERLLHIHGHFKLGMMSERFPNNIFRLDQALVDSLV